MIQRSTRLQRLKAKHDVTYDKVKTGAEKDIQSMKEQITESQVRMGELTKEKDALEKKYNELSDAYNTYLSRVSELGSQLDTKNFEIQQLQNENSDLKIIYQYYKSQISNVRLPDILEVQMNAALQRQAEREKESSLNDEKLLF